MEISSYSLMTDLDEPYLMSMDRKLQSLNENPWNNLLTRNGNSLPWNGFR